MGKHDDHIDAILNATAIPMRHEHFLATCEHTLTQVKVVRAEAINQGLNNYLSWATAGRDVSNLRYQELLEYAIAGAKFKIEADRLRDLITGKIG